MNRAELGVERLLLQPVVWDLVSPRSVEHDLHLELVALDNGPGRSGRARVGAVSQCRQQFRAHLRGELAHALAVDAALDDRPLAPGTFLYQFVQGDVGPALAL